MLALVDCNSFFASCEQVFRPDLRGKPVIVLSNNDGCIVARSKEAKALGIPDLEPYFKLKHQLEKSGVHVFSSNYELYGDLSNRVMQTLESFSPHLEIYSIDEAFLSLAGIKGDLRDYGHNMRQAVQQCVGLPVGVGIAPTKTLAKLASYIAKKSARCEFVCVIEQLDQWHKVFAKIPVQQVWGIGGRLTKRLADQRIFSVLDLMKQDPRYMKRHYNVNVARTVEELNGVACYGLDQQPPPKQQIFSTRSFGQKITDCAALEQSVSQYASRACVKLRKQHHLVKTIMVFAASGHFVDRPYSRSQVIPLPMATNDTRQVITAVRKAVNEVIYREGVKFARAGVGLIELQPERPEQLDVFTPVQPLRSKALMTVMDEINQRHTPVYFASQGVAPQWSMQRMLKSPSYTTQWHDLPCVSMK